MIFDLKTVWFFENSPLDLKLYLIFFPDLAPFEKRKEEILNIQFLLNFPLTDVECNPSLKDSLKIQEMVKE